MGNNQHAAASKRAPDPLVDAPLCVDERYYRDLTRPALRSTSVRRLRALTLLIGPALASVCFLLLIATMAFPLTHALRQRAPALASFLAKGRISLLRPLATPFGLAALTGLLLASAGLALWAWRDRRRERRIQATLEAKVSLAAAYRQYLEALVALTEPLRWMRPPQGTGEQAAQPTVLASTLTRSSDDEIVLATGGRAAAARNIGADSGVLVVARYGWETSVEDERARRPTAPSVERLTQALDTSASGAILLCADEGMGKTTLLRQLAHTQALAQLRRTTPGGRAPLYADLAWLEGEWPRQSTDTLESALTMLVQRIGGLRPEMARALAEALAHGPSLLLLDELDTLPDDAREEASAAVARFLSGRRTPAAHDANEPTVQMAIGARVYHAPLGDGTRSARLERWTIEPTRYLPGQRALIRGALAQRDKAASNETAEALLRGLAIPQTETWPQRPLALTLVAIASERTNEAAQYLSRTDLLAAATSELHVARTPDWSASDRQALRTLAEELALWLHLQGRRAFQPATPEIDSYLSHLPETATIAARTAHPSPSQAVALHSGLCELGPAGVMTFSQRSFQSSLAGRALARRIVHEAPSPLPADALLSVYAHDSQRKTLALVWSRRHSAHWRDTLRSLSGALCSPGASLGERGERRTDIARAWLRAALAQRSDLDALELPFAADILAELRGDPAAEGLAIELAAALHIALSEERPTTHAALATLQRAGADVATHPGGRATLLDLLRDQLLGDGERAADQAARTFGALGRLGVEVAPMLVELLRSSIWTPRASVARALEALGPAAGPEARAALIDALDDQSLVVRVAALNALGATTTEGDAAVADALRARLDEPSASARAAAFAALGNIGADTPTVVDALTQALNDEEIPVQVAAAFALSKLASARQRIPALVEALNVVGWGDRAAAALALGEMGPDAQPAVPMLLEQARSDTVMGRALAIRSLAQIAPQRADVTEALIERLSDEAPEPRRAAAESLALRRVANASRTWPALLLALRDSKESVRLAAAHALDTQGATTDAGAIASLISLLEDSRGYVRAAAARTLGSLDGADAQTLAARIGSLDSLRDELRLVAVDELGAVGLHARAATAALTGLLRAPRWEMRQAALRALRRVAAPTASASASVRRITDPEPLVRLEAVKTLASVASDKRIPTDVVEALQGRLLEDGDSAVRATAATALGRMGPRARAALPALFRALSDPDGDTQRAVALAIGALRPPLATTLPQLTARLSDPTRGARAAVALALGALGPGAAQAVTTDVLQLLKDESPLTRAAAAEALGLLGPSISPAARDALMQRLNDLDSETRAAAATALGRVGAGDDLDWAALTDALLLRTHDQRYIVRRATVEALTMLGSAAVRAAEERLLELLADPDSATRRDALTALATLDADGQIEALPTLLTMLNSSAAHERATAADALAALHTTLDTDTQERIVALLKAEQTIVRVAGARAIGALSETTFIGAAPIELVSALGDEDWQIRAAAAEALGSFADRFSAGERDALRNALADPDETTRQAAAEALGRCAPASTGPIVAELLDMLKAPRATGLLAGLGQRRELEVYAAMERPTWAIARRMPGWLRDDTHWATQRDALALILSWRYAPAAARQRLLELSTNGASLQLRMAAYRAARAAISAAPDASDIDPVTATGAQRDLRAITVENASAADTDAPGSRGDGAA